MFNLFTRRPAVSIRTEVARLDGSGIGGDIQQQFADFLEQAEDSALLHFNPRYLAEVLALEERPTLKLLLSAVYEGIVTMHWDLRCPVCGNLDHRHDSLEHLHREIRCPFCSSIYDPHLDHEVRVTFSPHQRLRVLPKDLDNRAFRDQVDERLGIVSGLVMLALPDFQRLFPQQRLPPNESLDVTRLALLFTDLAGSTALYARRGDPRAYHLVRLHFEELFRAADTCGGTIVKTIGDAILGVFQTGRDAMDAALMMQSAIADLNQRRNLAGEERLILKVGLHSGPCLCVTLNNRPDYFGTTVNTAARVQGLSQGEDIVFTSAIRDDPQVAPLLEHRRLSSSYAKLKGIAEDTLVYYLALE